MAAGQTAGPRSRGLRHCDLAIVNEAGDVLRYVALPLGMTPNGCLAEPAKKRPAAVLTPACSWMSPDSLDHFH